MALQHRLREFYLQWSRSTETTGKFEAKTVLDPLSTVIRLYSLMFRPERTKLVIEHNSVSFSTPSVYQGLLRRVHNASRNDLCFFKEALSLYCELYDVKDGMFRMFAEGAIRGLERFASCYRETPNNLALNTIEYYQLMLRNHIDTADRSERETEPESKGVAAAPQPEDKEEMTERADHTALADPLMVESKDEFGKRLNLFLQSLWTPRQIKIVYWTFRELETTSSTTPPSDVLALLASIDSILSSKDARLQDLMGRAPYSYE